MGAPRKDPERRQNRATKETVVELVTGGLVVPDPSDHWLPETLAEWSAFWSDPELVSIVRESQRSALVRLFDLRDRMRLAWTEADTFRDAVGDWHLVAGSTGQMVANPLYGLAEKAEARALQIEGRIQALEASFGLTPAAMLKLGVDFQRQQTLAAANERVKEAAGVAAQGSTPNDPRSLPGDTAVRSS